MSVEAGDTFRFLPGERGTLAAQVTMHAAALRGLVIAIDGPAGSGKSTTARGVANRLGLRHLDTGALYRAITWAALRDGIDASDEAGLVRLVQAAPLGIACKATGQTVTVGNEDVTAVIRTPAVTAVVSQVSAWPAVRDAMLELQRRLARHGGTVMEGRDIGTVVLPGADLKVFLTADVATRAARRQSEDAAGGIVRPQAAVEDEIRARDHADSTRASAPLQRAPDAVVLDTTTLGIDDQIDAVVALALRLVQARAIGGRQVVDPATWAQPGYRAVRHGRYRLAQVLIGGAFRHYSGMRREVHPAARLPGSALVACNHIAGLDPPLVGAALPFEVCYVAKRELFRHAAFGSLLRWFNAFPIRRGTADYAALDHAIALLEGGHNVLMFPEGTRQKPGRLGTPRWGFGYVALRARRPIVPVFIRGSRDVHPRFRRREPLEVWVGAPVVLRELPDTPEGYAQAGADVMERIAGLMLRSAARTPLPGLELPGPYAARGAEP